MFWVLVSDDLKNKMYEFLNYKDLKSLLSCARVVWTGKGYDMLRKKAIDMCFPMIIAPLLYRKKVPVLDLKERVGFTQYIDFIKPSEVDDFCFGRDKYTRAFVSINHGNGVFTLFQRYSDNKVTWTVGGVFPNGLVHTHTHMTLEDGCEDERLDFFIKALSA